MANKRGGLSKREYWAKQTGRDKKEYKSSSKKKKKSSSSSKDRGGLSKREFAAREAGGKLDYKTGRIAVKKPVQRPRGYGISGGSSDEEYKQLISGTNDDGSYYGPAFEDSYINDYVKTDKENQRKKASKSKKSSSLSTGQKLFGKLSGTKTANAQTTRPRPTPTNKNTRKSTGFERGLERLKDPLGLEPRIRSLIAGQGFGNKIYQQEDSTGDAITQALSGRLPELGISEQIFDQPNPYDDGGYKYDGPINDISYDVPEIDDNFDYNIDENNRRDPTPTDGGGNISDPTPTAPVPDFTQQFVEPQPADGGAIQGDNPTIQKYGGRGFYSQGQYGNGAGLSPTNGLPNIGAGSLGFGGGEEDELGMIQQLINTLSGTQTANAEGNPQDNGGFSGNTRYGPSKSFADLPDNYLSDSGMGLLGRQRQQEAQTPQPEDKQITDNYEDDYTGGGGNMNNGQLPERGKLSRREYKAKYGIDYDPTGGLGDFGYAGDDSFKDQGNEIQDQLKNMIKGIEAQYATAQTKQTGDLERQGRQNLNQLNSNFSFGNSDPNDEQRIQYQQRLQNDQGRNLAELLSSLQASKGQDILSARNQGSSNMQNLMNQQRTARSTAQGNQRDFQSQQQAARQSQANSNRSNRTKGVFSGYNQDGTKKYINPYTGEEMFSGGQGTDPTATNGPERSTNPIPGRGPNGNVIDNNPYSNTYGRTIKTDKDGRQYVE